MQDHFNAPLPIDDDPAPAFARFRAEGLNLREALPGSLSYLRKYLQKRTTGTTHHYRHFEQQRTLLREERVSARLPPAAEARLGFVGDIMWIRRNWDRFLDPGVHALMSSLDACLGNLETPISRKHPVQTFWPDYVTFNSPPDLLQSFRRTSGRNLFTALSFANNHTLDCGDAGAEATLEFLDSEGILHAGVRQRRETAPWVPFTVNGIRFGFHASTWGLNDPEQLRRSSLWINKTEGLAPERNDVTPEIGPIREALSDMQRAGVEFKIVSIHWGHEFEYYPSHVVMRTARALIDAGADVIMGHHPHVLQPSEIYEPQSETAGARRGLILYSLGNFATAMYTWPCRIGVIQQLRVFRESSGRVRWENPERTFVVNRAYRLQLADAEDPRALSDLIARLG